MTVPSTKNMVPRFEDSLPSGTNIASDPYFGPVQQRRGGKSHQPMMKLIRSGLFLVRRIVLPVQRKFGFE